MELKIQYGNRQLDSDCSALADLALHGDFATVQVYAALEQSMPIAIVLRTIVGPELELLQFVLEDASVFLPVSAGGGSEPLDRRGTPAQEWAYRLRNAVARN